MMQITKAEWERKKYHGYTLIKDGIRYILTLDNGGTVLAPVEIVDNKQQEEQR